MMSGKHLVLIDSTEPRRQITFVRDRRYHFMGRCFSALRIFTALSVSTFCAAALAADMNQKESVELVGTHPSDLSIAIVETARTVKLAAHSQPRARPLLDKVESIDAATAKLEPTLPLLSVNQIVERNAAARGGLAAWRSLDSLSEFGHMEIAKLAASMAVPKSERRSNGMKPREPSMPFTMHLKRPHQLHLEIQFQGATAVKVFNGKQGWTILPSSKGPVATPFPPQEVQAAAAQQDMEGPLIDSAAKGISVALEGMEIVDGRKTYRLKLVLNDGQVRHLWVDAETFLDAKIDGSRVIAGEVWPVETYFSSYKKVHGLSIPHVLDTAVAGVRSTERIVIDHVVINPILNESEFAPTAVTRGMR